jgi:hypothetical protein
MRRVGSPCLRTNGWQTLLCNTMHHSSWRITSAVEVKMPRVLQSCSMLANQLYNQWSQLL